MFYRSKNIRAPEKQVLSDSEIMRFFKICDDSDSVYGCLLGMTLCTGLRIREAMAVSWSNVNRDLKTLKIQSQVSNGVLIPTTKTRRERKISLSRAAISFMEKASRYSVNGNSNGLIFTAEKGSPLSYTNVTRKLNEIALEMGRPDITAHTLRHTYMTVSSRCGENLNEIQNEVGHGYSSDVITEYLHQTEESIIESANRRQEYLVKLINDNGGLNGLFL
jgi:integrase